MSKQTGAIMEITDAQIEAIAGTDELTGDAILRFARSILALEQDAALPVVPAPIRPPSLDVALSMCREANSEAKLPTPMCWDLALYVQRLEQAFAAPSQPGNAPIAAPKWMRLYDAANALTAWLGYEGEISTRNSLAIELESALHAIDGGNPPAPIAQQDKQ